jgi:hypothetical protein
MGSPLRVLGKCFLLTLWLLPAAAMAQPSDLAAREALKTRSPTTPRG